MLRFSQLLDRTRFAVSPDVTTEHSRRRISSAKRKRLLGWAMLGSFGLGQVVFAVLTTSPALAQESKPSDKETIPGAPRLLPSDSMFYLRLDEADQLRLDMKKSSLGRMINDPKLRPFADQFYATGRDLFEQISETVGVTLDELLSIPHGQVALAIHPAKPLEDDERAKIEARENEDESALDRRRNRQRLRDTYSFGGTLIIDAGKNIDQLMAMVQKMEDAAITGGFKRRVKDIDGTDVIRLIPNRANQQSVEFFEKEGTLVIGVGYQSAQDVLKHWLDDSDEPTLADNAKFGTILSRCVGAESTRPQFTFFVDPHLIADRAIKRSGSMAAGLFWPVIQDLGVSRIGGIGGSSFYGGDVFEGIAHYHINIEPPRDGVLGALRPETGDTAPPKWVPAKISGYTSLNWDIAQTYENVGKVIDRFQGADSLKRFVEQPVATRLGIKVQEEIIENMTGRILRVSWLEKPIRVNSAVSCFAVEVKDSIKAKATIAKLRDRDPDRITLKTVNGSVVYRLRGPGDNFPQALRKPEPQFLLLGKWLIYADSTKFVEKVALANSGNSPRLLELPEYELVAGELGGKLNGESPFMLAYLDGAESFRALYDLGLQDTSKQFLRQVGENNQVARKFGELLDNNELPPFSEFEKYFAPTGVFAYDEPDGIHFGLFTLRADATDDE